MICTDIIAPVGELVRRHAENRPQKLAFQDAHSSVTYGELAASTANLAGHLQDAGIDAGDCVAVFLPNSVAWVESCFAIVRAGAICVPISYDATLQEVLYRLQDAGCKAIVTTDERAALVASLAGEHPALKTIILVSRGETRGDGLRFDDLRSTPARSVPRDAEAMDAPSFIIYTSGTTGKAKGVLLSQHSMLWVAAACWAPIAGLSESDHVLSPLPLFHSYALNLTVLSILAVGASEYIVEKFSTTETMELLQSGRFTIFPGVPTMFHYLLEAARSNPGARFPGLRLCLSAGAIMPAPVNKEFEERFGVMLLDGYGITETSTMVTLNWQHGGRVLGSCGLPVPGLSTRVIDPLTGLDVETGAEGELIVRGPNLMKGYHGKPNETEQAIRNGWYHTGDLARSDKCGFLTITGRLKEVIIRGGQNIAPAEVEEAVCAFPAVLDCAVVGAPHRLLGEVPVVFVVPREGMDVVVDDLIVHCRERLSAYKIPGAVHVVQEIPRTGSGKIIRYKLKETLAED
ncbi:class I adenylate-forming enzyme family protein [Noviherbaspirillum denitrificans]|uniref:Long-chain fatty acid--CoA ligase n=1 Tax=Noviherbaspirillum denitrificans TaxID=1968433 RepID=A0A254TGE9_9BURK|nr:class I adenylate-forming enzyme family protein [Noviherbaspirillum denitrificans]OWW20372.1 long-chain fatty acid--CoA ligase [Noviherbaspirillum denitrificans]